MMRLLIALAILLLSTIAVDAATQCLNRQQARAIYPGQYLFWRTVAGKRCWSIRRLLVNPRTSPQAAPPRPAPPIAPAPPQIIVLPDGLLPPYDRPAPHRFAWEGYEARGEERGAISEPPAARRAPIYSTFEFDPPDIWPPLSPALCLICIATWVTVLLVIALLSLALGQLLAGVAPHKLPPDLARDA